jgi:sugar phosphate isomerase/epimerase
MASLPIALQLYTVRDHAEPDFPSLLRQVAALGYTAVEFAGFGGLDASVLRALLEELHLQAPSAHCIRYTTPFEEVRQTLDYLRELGSEYAVLPWLGPQALIETPFAELVEHLTTLGKLAQDAGLQFVYHNHDYSFHRAADGHFLLDDVCAAIDPALFKLELDVYWAQYAEVDPIAFLREHQGRVALLHLKDMAADRSMTEVGDGVMDNAGIIAAGEQAGARWLVVEHDHPTIPSLESARRSLENLHTRIYPRG